MYCPTPRGAARVAKSARWGTNTGTVDSSFRATCGAATNIVPDGREVASIGRQRLSTGMTAALMAIVSFLVSLGMDGFPELLLRFQRIAESR